MQFNGTKSQRTKESRLDRSPRFVIFFRPFRDFHMILIIDPALKRWAILTFA